MTFFVKQIAAALSVALISVAGHASVTFDFTDGTDSSNSMLSFSEGGLDLDVTADRFNGTPGDVFWDELGLGVLSGQDGDINQVDGRGANDRLIFSFSSVVEVLSVTFSDVENNDRFRFFLDTNENGVLQGGNSVDSIGTFNMPGTGNGSVYQFQTSQISDLVGVAASGNRHDFYVAAIEVSAVPEPATWLMMLAGFAVTGAALKRRKGAALAA